MRALLFLAGLALTFIGLTVLIDFGIKGQFKVNNEPIGPAGQSICIGIGSLLLACGASCYWADERIGKNAVVTLRK